MTTASAIDLQDALARGRQARHELERTVQLLDRAHGIGRADLYWNFLGLDLFKYFHLFRARRAARRTREHLVGFKEALGGMQLPPGIAARVDLNPGVVLADVVEDFLGDFLAQSRIEKMRRQANIGLSRLRRVLKALEASVATDASSASA